MCDSDCVSVCVCGCGSVCDSDCVLYILGGLCCVCVWYILGLNISLCNSGITALGASEAVAVGVNVVLDAIDNMGVDAESSAEDESGAESSVCVGGVGVDEVVFVLCVCVRSGEDTVRYPVV